ncbi:ankyrin [Periconia macrospinosa]|uniref:Ankyrin n=1 Tax=Periconia macrospinosa TaxID=97972 RepID=A0A2V1EB58_9PLEO|nr:ankyrin [Periconia macrospinosa]
MAALNNDPVMVKFLLSRGASPNVSRLRGTPLEKAALSSSIPIISALLNAGGKLEGSAAFSIAAANGRIDVLEVLLDRGADINKVPNPDLMLNQTDFDEVKNGLCAAAERGNSDVVRFLLKRGADVSVKDGKGITALGIARINSHESYVALLFLDVGFMSSV